MIEKALNIHNSNKLAIHIENNSAHKIDKILFPAVYYQGVLKINWTASIGYVDKERLERAEQHYEHLLQDWKIAKDKFDRKKSLKQSENLKRNKPIYSGIGSFTVPKPSKPNTNDYINYNMKKGEIQTDAMSIISSSPIRGFQNFISEYISNMSFSESISTSIEQGRCVIQGPKITDNFNEINFDTEDISIEDQDIFFKNKVQKIAENYTNRYLNDNFKYVKSVTTNCKQVDSLQLYIPIYRISLYHKDKYKELFLDCFHNPIKINHFFDGKKIFKSIVFFILFITSFMYLGYQYIYLEYFVEKFKYSVIINKEIKEVNIRSEPNSESAIVRKIIFGDTLQISEEKNGWLKIFGQNEWIRSNTVTKTSDEANK